MTQADRQLITSGFIAKKLGVSLARVTHILATRPHIVPLATGGAMRFYRYEALAMVRHELNAVDAKRSARTIGKAGQQP